MPVLQNTKKTGPEEPFEVQKLLDAMFIRATTEFDEGFLPDTEDVGVSRLSTYLVVLSIDQQC